MKKKVLLTALSSVFALGVLGACGDIDNDPVNDGNGLNGNDEFNNDMDNNDGDM